MTVRYSDDPVTDATVKAIIGYQPMFLACYHLAKDTREEAMKATAQPTTEDLQALIGSRIQDHYGEKIAGLLADGVNWEEVGTEALKGVTPADAR
jgi:hypothetical protein